MVVPIFRGETQALTVVDKQANGAPRLKEVCEVRFARLEGRKEQLARWLGDRGASVGVMPQAALVEQEPNNSCDSACSGDNNVGKLESPGPE